MIRERIHAAAERAGRDPASIRLVAVSKRHPVEAIAAAVAAGQLDFGENYASELAEKAATLEPRIRWHLIGPLQRRQAGRLPQNVVLWHTLDRVEILERFRRLDRTPPPCLVQVNIGNEPQKAGIAPTDVRAFLERVLADFPEARIRGLMTIPPAGSAEQTRPYFAALRQLGDSVRDLLPEPIELSMGMSHDFEAAIAEGATIVRIGSAIFGPRPATV